MLTFKLRVENCTSPIYTLKRAHHTKFSAPPVLSHWARNAPPQLGLGEVPSIMSRCVVSSFNLSCVLSVRFNISKSELLILLTVCALE